MGPQESGELVVYSDSIAKKLVIESDVPAIGVAATSGYIPTPVWAVDTGGVILEPGIKPFSPEAPMAVEGILETEPADPAPAPVITSPVCFV